MQQLDTRRTQDHTNPQLALKDEQIRTKNYKKQKGGVSKGVGIMFYQAAFHEATESHETLNQPITFSKKVFSDKQKL